MISDLFFHIMYIVDKSEEISNETVFMIKMADVKRYKTANFVFGITGISQKSVDVLKKKVCDAFYGIEFRNDKTD